MPALLKTLIASVTAAGVFGAADAGQLLRANAGTNAAAATQAQLEMEGRDSLTKTKGETHWWRADRKLKTGEAEVHFGANWGHNPGPKSVDMGDISGYLYECPHPVNKDNWLGRDGYGDKFKIEDLGDGKFKATREDTGNTASGWGMDLRVPCKRTIRDGFFEVVVGSNHGHNPGAKTISHSVGDGFTVKCPNMVKRGNWLGGDTYGDTFDIDASGGSIKATRTDGNDPRWGWGMNLRFVCEKVHLPVETHTGQDNDAPPAPEGDKFYAIIGKLSGRTHPLAPGVGVHCLNRDATIATDAPYDHPVWAEKHSKLSVQCCGAENFRDDSDPNKKWVVKTVDGVAATRFTRNVPPTGAWSTDACESGKTLDEAFSICASNGLRLCTKDEVMANENNIGCGTSSNLQWTSTPCDGNGENPDDGDTITEELENIREQFNDLVAAEVPATEAEEKEDDKFECTTSKNFITGQYNQIEVNLNGQASRQIFDEGEAVAFCKNECDKRNCKAFWYQRHKPDPNEARGTHGYKLCAFYMNEEARDKSNWVQHGHGGLSQACRKK
jgi:hypothetical protein